MAEVHRKILVAEASVNFSTNLNSLADGDIAWSDPITTLEDCDFADVWALIDAGTSVGGNVEFYAARQGTALSPAGGIITTTGTGAETTTTGVADVLACLGAPVKAMYMDTDGEEYTVQFRVWFPGSSLQLFVHNDSAAAFASSGHSVYITGWGPEV